MDDSFETTWSVEDECFISRAEGFACHGDTEAEAEEELRRVLELAESGGTLEDLLEDRIVELRPIALKACPDCGWERGAGHGILCPSPRSDTHSSGPTREQAIMLAGRYLTVHFGRYARQADEDALAALLIETVGQFTCST